MPARMRSCYPVTAEQTAEACACLLPALSTHGQPRVARVLVWLLRTGVGRNFLPPSQRSAAQHSTGRRTESDVDVFLETLNLERNKPRVGAARRTSGRARLRSLAASDSTHRTQYQSDQVPRAPPTPVRPQPASLPTQSTFDHPLPDLVPSGRGSPPKTHQRAPKLAPLALLRTGTWPTCISTAAKSG